MTIAECLSVDRVTFLSASTKHEALSDLIDLLSASDAVKDRHALTQAIWKREEMMSTGIGMGIAVPHVRIKGVNRLVLALGVHCEGLSDYASIDNKPVHLVAMIAAGEEQHEEYIRMLAQVVETLKDEKRREAILQAETPEQVHAIVAGA